MPGNTARISSIVVIAGWLVALLAWTLPTHGQEDEAGWLLEQVNGLRANTKLPGYVLNDQLSAAATQHSNYMAETCDVAHEEATGSTPEDRARANGYPGSWINENIWGGQLGTANAAWSFWVNSPPHYSNMVSRRMNEIGIGVVSGACGQYYTLLFGYRSEVDTAYAPDMEETTPPDDASGEAQAAPPTQPEDEAGWLRAQVGALRAQVGVPGYVTNDQLSAAAALHSLYMAETCDVSHTQITGSTPADRAQASGYTGSQIGETVYGGGRANATSAWNNWLAYSANFDLLVNRDRNEIGVGVAYGECGQFYTLVFGYSPDVTPPPPPTAAPSTD